VKSDVFFVIAGAFGVKENAENLVMDLRSKGYDSSINGQNRRGLYIVSIQGFSDKKLATQKMHEYRAGEFPNAWLLSRE
jgi:cell division protein FtsN